VCEGGKNNLAEFNKRGCQSGEQLRESGKELLKRTMASFEIMGMIKRKPRDRRLKKKGFLKGKNKKGVRSEMLVRCKGKGKEK